MRFPNKKISLPLFSQNIHESFCLAIVLFKGDLKSKYRESFLGYIWTLAPSIILTLSFYLAFESNILSTGKLPLPYPIFAFSAIILWQLFSELVLSISQGLIKARPLMLRVKVDTNAIIVSKILEVAFDFCIKLLFLFLMIMTFGVSLSQELLYFPVGIFTIFSLGIAIGLIVCPVALLVQDLNRLLPTALSFGMFLTPIFYNSPKGSLAVLVNLNPMSHPIIFSRGLLYGQVIWNGLPLITVLTTFVLLPIAYRFNKISIPIIIERLGN